jgi:hypothetical protein
MFQWRRSRQTEKKSSRSTRSYRPRVEELEDRTAPSSTGFVPLPPFQSLGLAASTFSHSAGAGDFNGDGKTDLVVANGGTTGTITLLTGTGNGRFNAVGTAGSTNSIALKNTIGGVLSGVAVADFNNDGISDVAVVESNFTTGQSRIHILFGGTSGLTEVSTLNPNSVTAVTAIAVGNFDASGNTDIAVAEKNNFIDFFFNQGGGAFSAPAQLNTTQLGASALVVGQFNGDTVPDLEVGYTTPPTGPVTITTLIGTGAGAGTNNTHFNLGPNTTVATLGMPLVIDMASPFVTGQITATPFLVVTTGTTQAFVLPSNNNGTFNPNAIPVALGLPAGQTANTVLAADFNADGLPDFATGNSNGTVSIVKNNGSNSFSLFTAPPANPVVFSSNSVLSLALGRFTNSGKRDLVGVDLNSTTMISQAGVLQNQFNTRYFAVGSGPGTQALVNIYADTGTGQLTGTFFPYLQAAFTGGVRVAVGDVNGDGVPDIAVAAGPGLGGAALIKVYDGQKLLNLINGGGIQNGNAESALLGLFQPYGNNGAGLGNFVAIGDFNGTGIGEVAIGADVGAQPQVSIVAFANGQFLAPPNQAFPQFATLVGPASFTGGVRVAAGDVNGDGKDDLITSFGPGGQPVINIFLGQEDGMPRSATTKLWINTNKMFTFTGIFSVPVFTGGVFVSAGDFDGDGLADVAASAGPGAGPQVELFRGSAIKRFINGGAAINQGPPDASAFNNILVPPGNPYLGGATLGVAVGLYPDSSNPGGTMLQRILLSGSGPGGNQVQGFDAYQFLSTSLFTSGNRPNGAIPGFFFIPPSAAFSGGQFVSTTP